jgi:hypothetical protein
MPRGRWGTVGEAAAHYGVTRQRINQLIAKGGFAGARLVKMPRGAVWYLPFPFQREALRNGRPPKAEKGKR